MADVIELSIEETNKLRAQLGLRLLPVAGESTIPEFGEKEEEDEGHEDHDNVSGTSAHDRSTKDNDGDEQSAETFSWQKPDAVDFLYGSSGSEPSSGAQNTALWLALLGSQPPETKPGQNPPKILPEESSASAEFSVAHSASELAKLADGEVLTLADSHVLADSTDEYVHERLSRDAQTRRAQKERKLAELRHFGRPLYITELGEELDGEHDGSAAVIAGETIFVARKETKPQMELKRGVTSLTEGLFDDETEALPPPPMKKFKKKLRAKKRRLEDDGEFLVTQPMATLEMEADEEHPDELEAVLAQARVKKNRMRLHKTAAELAEEVRLHQRADLAGFAGGFVYDDTREFLETVGAGEKEKSSGEKEKDAGSGDIGGLKSKSQEEEELSGSPTAGGDKDETVSAKDVAVSAKDVAETVKNGEESTGATGEASSAPVHERAEPVHDEAEEAENSVSESAETGPSNAGSILATLKYLRANGVSRSSIDKERRDLQRQAELARIQIGIEERLVRKVLAADPSFRKQQPEDQQKTVDRVLNERLVAKGIIQQAAPSRYGRNTSDGLANYNPEVRLQYKDDKGQALNQKQAWKELSHRYHGLAPKRK